MPFLGTGGLLGRVLRQSVGVLRNLRHFFQGNPVKEVHAAGAVGELHHIHTLVQLHIGDGHGLDISHMGRSGEGDTLGFAPVYDYIHGHVLVVGIGGIVDGHMVGSGFIQVNVVENQVVVGIGPQVIDHPVPGGASHIQKACALPLIQRILCLKGQAPVDNILHCANPAVLLPGLYGDGLQGHAPVNGDGAGVSGGGSGGVGAVSGVVDDSIGIVADNLRGFGSVIGAAVQGEPGHLRPIHRAGDGDSVHIGGTVSVHIPQQQGVVPLVQLHGNGLRHEGFPGGACREGYLPFFAAVYRQAGIHLLAVFRGIVEGHIVGACHRNIDVVVLHGVGPAQVIHHVIGLAVAPHGVDAGAVQGIQGRGGIVEYGAVGFLYLHSHGLFRAAQLSVGGVQGEHIGAGLVHPGVGHRAVGISEGYLSTFRGLLHRPGGDGAQIGQAIVPHYRLKHNVLRQGVGSGSLYLHHRSGVGNGSGADDRLHRLTELLGGLNLTVVGGMDAVHVVRGHQPAVGIHQVGIAVACGKRIYHLGDFAAEIAAEGGHGKNDGGGVLLPHQLQKGSIVGLEGFCVDAGGGIVGAHVDNDGFGGIPGEIPFYQLIPKGIGLVVNRLHHGILGNLAGIAEIPQIAMAVGAGNAAVGNLHMLIAQAGSGEPGVGIAGTVGIAVAGGDGVADELNNLSGLGHFGHGTFCQLQPHELHFLVVKTAVYHQGMLFFGLVNLVGHIQGAVGAPVGHGTLAVHIDHNVTAAGELQLENVSGEIHFEIGTAPIAAVAAILLFVPTAKVLDIGIGAVNGGDTCRLYIRYEGEKHRQYQEKACEPFSKGIAKHLGFHTVSSFP